MRRTGEDRHIPAGGEGADGVGRGRRSLFPAIEYAVSRNGVMPLKLSSFPIKISIRARAAVAGMNEEVNVET